MQPHPNGWTLCRKTHSYKNTCIEQLVVGIDWCSPAVGAPLLVSKERPILAEFNKADEYLSLLEHLVRVHLQTV